MSICKKEFGSKRTSEVWPDWLSIEANSELTPGMCSKLPNGFACVLELMTYLQIQFVAQELRMKKEDWFSLLLDPKEWKPG